MDFEIVPWNEEGLALVWSWPGQEGACAGCATAALRDGAEVRGAPVDGPRACARCGAEIAAVHADADVDADDLDLCECGDLDYGEADDADREYDPLEYAESDACFPEPPDVDVAEGAASIAERIARATAAARRRGDREAAFDRGVGALLGHAVGDALGVGAEFLSGETVNRWYPRGLLDYADIVRDGHRARWQPGEGTDDTGQMLALAAACADPAVWDEDSDAFERALAARLVTWFETDPRGIGKHTVRVLGDRRFAIDPLGVAASVDRAARGRGASNGSLMRVTPVGVALHAAPERAAAWGARSSALTHPDPRCVDACRVVAWTVASLVGGAAVSDVLAGARAVAREEETRAWLVRAEERAPDELGLDEGTRSGEANRMGYVYFALAAAMSALGRAPGFEIGLRSVIEAGGDADTNGAVAGGVLGARFGAQALPRRWVRPLRVANACRARAEELLGVGR